MLDVQDIRHQLETGNFVTAQAELNEVRRSRQKQDQPTEDLDDLQIEIDEARRQVIDEKIDQTSQYIVNEQWEEVISIVDQIAEIDPKEPRALRLRQQASEALQKASAERSIEEIITDARRRVEFIHSRQDAVMAVAFIEAKVANTDDERLLHLLREARAREEEIRKNENILSTLEQRNEMVSLLNLLEEEYKKGTKTITINGQIREVVSYLPQVRASVRTAMEDKANEYIARVRNIVEEAPRRALQFLVDAQNFPELPARKHEQIDDELARVQEHVNRWERAEALLEQAQARSHIAPNEALAFLRQAHSLAPQLPGVQNELTRLRREVTGANLQQLSRLLDDYAIQLDRVQNQADAQQVEQLWHQIATLADATIITWQEIQSENDNVASILVLGLATRMQEFEQHYQHCSQLRAVGRAALSDLEQARDALNAGQLELAEQHLERARSHSVLQRAVQQVESLLAQQKGVTETYQLVLQRKRDGQYNEALELLDKLPVAQQEELRQAILSARMFDEGEIAYRAGDLRQAQAKYDQVLRYQGDEQSHARARLAEIQASQVADQEIEQRLEEAQSLLNRSQYKQACDLLADLLKRPSSHRDKIRAEYHSALNTWSQVLNESVERARMDGASLAVLTQGFEATEHLRTHNMIAGLADELRIDEIRKKYHQHQAETAEHLSRWRDAHKHWLDLVPYEPTAAKRAALAEQQAIVAEAERERNPIVFLKRHIDETYRRSPILLKALVGYCIDEQQLDEGQAFAKQLAIVAGADSETQALLERITYEQDYSSDFGDAEWRYNDGRYYEAIIRLQKLIDKYPDHRPSLRQRLRVWRREAIRVLEQKTQRGNALERYLAYQEVALLDPGNNGLNNQQTHIYHEAHADLEGLLNQVVRRHKSMGLAELKSAEHQLTIALQAFSADTALVARIKQAITDVAHRVRTIEALERLLDEVKRLIGQNRIEEANALMVSKVEEDYRGFGAVNELREEINRLRSQRATLLGLLEKLLPAMQEERFDDVLDMIHRLRADPNLSLIRAEDWQGILPWRDPQSRKRIETIADLEEHWQTLYDNFKTIESFFQQVSGTLAKHEETYQCYAGQRKAPPTDLVQKTHEFKSCLQKAQEAWRKELHNLPEGKSTHAETRFGAVEELCENKVSQLLTNTESLIQELETRDAEIEALDREIEDRINNSLFDEKTLESINKALELDPARESFLWYEELYNRQHERTRNNKRKKIFGLF